MFLLTPVGWFVWTVERCAERHELEPLAAGCGNARRSRIDANEHTGTKLYLLSVDPHRPGALHHEVDLLHVRVSVVVLATLLVRRKDEVVEAERSRAERS